MPMAFLKPILDAFTRLWRPLFMAEPWLSSLSSVLTQGGFGGGPLPLRTPGVSAH